MHGWSAFDEGFKKVPRGQGRNTLLLVSLSGTCLNPETNSAVASWDKGLTLMPLVRELRGYLGDEIDNIS